MHGSPVDRAGALKAFREVGSVSDLFKLHEHAVSKEIERSRLEDEVRACHAVILSLLYVQGWLTVRHGTMAYMLGILERKAMGDLVKVTTTDDGTTIERRDE